MNTKNLLILAGALVILAAGVGLYLSKSQSQQQPTATQEVRQIESQSQSDNINSIGKDLNDTNVDNVDQETVQIQSELNASQ